MIVDVGSFLGATLVAEAEGLRSRGTLPDTAGFPDGRPIHGFERGFLPEPASPTAQRDRVVGDVTVHLGDSFVPRLERTVAPYADLVRLHVGDLLEQTWDGSPIELAFLDAGGTSALTSRIAATFLPSMTVGSTLVVRDVYSDQMPWLNVMLGNLADHFRWEGQVRASAVLTCTAPVPPDVAASDPFADAPLEECLRLHDALDDDGIGPEWRFLQELSRVRLLTLKGAPGDALGRLDRLTEQYADLAADERGPHAARVRRLGELARRRAAG